MYDHFLKFIIPFLLISVVVFAEDKTVCPNTYSSNYRLNQFPVQIQCNKNSVEYKLNQAIEFIEKTEFESFVESKDDTFRPHSLFKNWKLLLRQSVTDFDYIDRCGGEDVVAFVRSDIKGRIFLCANIIQSEQFTVFDFVTALLHEIRHFEGPTHVECSQGPLLYSRSCDENIQQNGSYAFSLWGYIQLAYGIKNLHPVTRLMARASSDVVYETRFNQKPKLEVNKVLVGLTENGQLIKIQKNSFELMPSKPVPPGSLFIINNYWYTISKKNYELQTIFNPLMKIDAINVVVSDDLNYSVRELQKKIVDFYRFQNIVGIIEKDKLTLICPQKNYELKLKKMISFVLTDRANNNKIQILRNDGYIETFYCDIGRFDSTPYDSEVAKHTIQLVKLNYFEYSLNQSGQVYWRQRLPAGGYSEWSQLPTEGRKIISLQVYDSKKYLDELQSRIEQQQD